MIFTDGAAPLSDDAKANLHWVLTKTVVLATQETCFLHNFKLASTTNDVKNHKSAIPE
jgi:hypothetical protein